jgi:uncharacterized membrane protein
MTIPKIFRDNRQYQIFGILLLSTLFDCLLLVYRLKLIDYDWSEVHSLHDLINQRGTNATFIFLIWNLFLAWIPYWISMRLYRMENQTSTISKISIGGILFLWLLFFPNAPYIITDLMHLYKQRGEVPFWLDVMLILSFAWTGLMLGFASMFEVERFLQKRYTVWQSRILMVASIWLAGFGVYMGRFQRLNSWDVFTHPLKVVRWELHVLWNPIEYLDTLGVAIALSGFMMIGYFTLLVLNLKNQ